MKMGAYGGETEDFPWFPKQSKHVPLLPRDDACFFYLLLTSSQPQFWEHKDANAANDAVVRDRPDVSFVSFLTLREMAAAGAARGPHW
jgi:hypothetical protein